jgi:hypothetical protein
MAQLDDAVDGPTPNLVGMTEGTDAPDRFGCGSIAMTLFAGLLIIFLLVAVILRDDLNLRDTFFNWSQDQQNQAGEGPGEGQDPADRPIPPVSDRYFAGGDVATTVTGDLHLTGTLELDPIASYAQEGLVWISFHDGGGTDVLIALNEPENSVTVAQGTAVAIGRDDECAFDIEVTGALVSGTVACTDIVVERDGESAGQATISIEFEAATDAEAGG